MEVQRRENYRKQEEELRAVLAASKASAVEDDQKREVNGERQIDPAHSEGGGTSNQANGLNIVKGKGGLNRFRHTSMSLKGKPKFWVIRDKDKEKDKDKDKQSSTDGLQPCRERRDSRREAKSRKARRREAYGRQA